MCWVCWDCAGTAREDTLQDIKYGIRVENVAVVPMPSRHGRLEEDQ